MSTARVAHLVLSGLLVAALAGCGSSTAIQDPAPSANLKGNWLIVGALPNFPSFPLPTSFSLAATLDVIDGSIYATQTDFYPCGNLGAGGADPFAVATIATDGGFTLQTAATPVFTPTITMTIKGALPTQPGAPWSGTYTGTSTNTGCKPVSGTFVAMPLPNLTGTFSGSGNLGASSSGTVMPVKLTVTLQQGGPASLDPPQGGRTVNSVNALGGWIQVSGSPCFTTGMAEAGSGTVFGSSFGLVFTMNDESTLFVNGNFTDTALSAITITSAHVEGGICSLYSGLFSADLTRQQ